VHLNLAAGGNIFNDIVGINNGSLFLQQYLHDRIKISGEVQDESWGGQASPCLPVSRNAGADYMA